jgi:hypothetical protein
MTKEQAIKWAGTNKDLADKLGLTQSAVSQWDEVPELQQYRLHHMSAGKLKLDSKYRISEVRP